MAFGDYFAFVPRLETGRLLLRAFGRADMERYLQIIGDPRVQRYRRLTSTAGGGENPRTRATVFPPVCAW